ncbi:MAG: alcohol dehydrogenase catalytic domain-containing protein [Oscillospiraceae bacterium]|nr:alcohol dehydrogenase catalytic domain-containing protein [Oscillospiraceae bacterium]
MKQAVMIEPGVIVFRDVPVPSVGDGDVKVKMKRIGICGSDIHVNHGKHPYTSYPVVQGHEVSAEVVEVGVAVSGLKPGDKVTIQPQLVCGTCYPCTHDQYNACESLEVHGFQTTGMASDYFVICAERVTKLPDDISFDHGAMIEPIAVCVHAIRRYGDVKDKSVLVLGGGPIGNLMGQCCKAMGAKNVLLSELSEFRLEVAKKCGIKTVNPREESLKEAMNSTFGPDGADVIFECVGVGETITQAIEYARKGSDIVVVGVFAEMTNINLGFVQDKELRLIGTAMFREYAFIEAIDLVGQGLINLDALITNHVPFDDFASAYKLIDEQMDKAMKVMIVMD